ncbi:MAG: cupin domain-containing protein [Bacteroidetes bacterium]|nr:cupin domain-containing protein [Bacteroidota bacterium]
MNSQEIIEKLQLKSHPEGGYYKETYRSEQRIELLPGKSRNLSTTIYYLLENDNKSHFHRIKSDEFWFFHQGEAMEIVFLQDQKMNVINLGNDLNKGEVPQAWIPANTWFAASVKESKGYSLVSCTVAPGFDFNDFELAKKEHLIQGFPQFETIIEKYSH